MVTIPHSRDNFSPPKALSLFNIDTALKKKDAEHNKTKLPTSKFYSLSNKNSCAIPHLEVLL
jgi:hypothetical protein